MVQNKSKEKIAMSLFSGAIIALFIFLGNIENNISLYKILVISILIGIILISLRVILEPSTDLHFIGNIIRKILRIK